MAALANSILITGASRGLGLEMVKQLVKSPPKVLIAACRNPDAAKGLQEIAKKNKCVKIIKLDVENDNDINSAVKQTKSLVGKDGLNLLINNAAIYMNKDDGGGVRLQSRERLMRHFSINSASPVIVTQKFLPLLEQAAQSKKTAPQGCDKAAAINISSDYGSLALTYKEGKFTSIDYKCSKSAVSMAGILMARDLKDSGILVLNVHPGWVRTEMGGPDADLTEQESVEGVLKVLKNAKEKDTGLLLDHKGSIVPF